MWMIVPPLITSFILGRYYDFRYSLANRPKKGTPVYQSHYSRLFAAVILGYFVYCMGQYAHKDIWRASWYREFGVPRSSDQGEELVGKAFRSAVKTLHPDKNPGVDPQKFIRIKGIYEILHDPQKRAKFDVYGRSALTASTVEEDERNGRKRKNPNADLTTRDYFNAYIPEWLGFYGGSLAMMVVVGGWLLGGKHGYWKFLALVSAMLFELWIVLNPTRFGSAALKGGYKGPLGFLLKPLLDRLWFDWTVHERLLFLRQAVAYTCMAMPQLATLYQSIIQTGKAASPHASLSRPALVTKVYDTIHESLTKEVGLHFSSAFEPVRDNVEIQEHLKRRMGQLAVELKTLELLDPTERRRLNKKQQ